MTAIFLTNFDLAEFLDDTGTLNIKTYKQLETMTRPEQIFENHDYCILFLPTISENVGHWQILLKGNGLYYFFDSYAEDTLTIHIKKILGNIIINNVQYQEYNPNIATCGKWCLYCLYLYKIYDKKFNFNLMYKVTRSIIPKDEHADEFIANLISKDLAIYPDQVI